MISFVVAARMARFRAGLAGVLCAALICGVAPARSEDVASPVGTWTTIDDSSGKPTAVVRIDDIDGALSGKIIKLFPGPGEAANPLCTACSDARRDQPIIGMVILTGLKREADGDAWSGGEILDPDNGKIYRCRVTLSEDGRTLRVRGFIGFSLLGRTQVWTRASD